MNCSRHIFIAFLCLLVASSVAQAQNDWDSVLDRYEKITQQCISLRDKAAAGERVSQKSVTALFGELSRLRNSLQQASGKMTAKQRERFRRVRELYDGKMAGQVGHDEKSQADDEGALRLRSGPGVGRSGTGKGNTVGTEEVVSPELSSHQPAGEQSRIPVGERSRTTGNSMVEPLPKVEGWTAMPEILRSAQNDSLLRNATPVILSGAAGGVKDLPRFAGGVKDLPRSAGGVKDHQAGIAEASEASEIRGTIGRPETTGTMTGKHLTFNAIPTLSIGDTRQGGIFLSLSRGRLGGYLTARTNFVSQLYAYECLSDGTIPIPETSGDYDGSLPTTVGFTGNGRQRLGEYSAAAGVVRSITPWLDLYAGAGYGSSTLCWGDNFGAWAKVKDYSGAGLQLDGGALFHFGRVSILGGISYLTARPQSGPFKPVFTLGAGISFQNR